MKQTRDHIHLLVPIDITYIKPHIDNINNALKASTLLCQQNTILKESECTNILQPLVLRLIDIRKDYSAISHLTSGREKRSAWLAGVGSLFKQVIGTMDEDDAIRYNNAIQTLNNNNIKLASILKDNILVTSTALSRYNKTLETITTNEGRLNDAIIKLSNTFNNLSILSDKLYIKSKMNDVYTELSSCLLTLSFKLDDLVNAMLFAKTNTLHPSVMTPNQFYNELTSNVRKLPNYEELPLDLDLDTIHALIDISKISCYFVNNKLVFVIKIPLVNSFELDLFKAISVPIPHNMDKPNSYAMIVPSCNYVGISKDKLTYTCISNLKSCTEPVNRVYICDDTDTRSIQETPTCETDILTKIVTEIPIYCQTKLMYGQIDIWQELQGNKWIFVQSEPSKLSVQCNSDLIEFKILGTGILNIRPNCTAYCRNKQLFGKSNIDINVKTIVSDFNLINEACCNLEKFNISKPKLLASKLSNIDLEKLPSVINNQMLSDVDKIINNPSPNLIEYSSHYPLLTYLVLILILIFISYKLCKKFGKYSGCKTKPKLQNDSTLDNDPEPETIPLPRLRINS